MKKVLACLICVAFLIVGCDTPQTNDATLHTDSGYAKPNIIEYKGLLDTGYYYVVDKNTNTVYIIFRESYSFGIAPAVWPDGKPVTVDELEHNFKR